MRRLTQEEAINGYAWANDSIRLNKETFERETSDVSKMVSVPIYDEVKAAVEYGIAFQRNAIWHRFEVDKPTSTGSTYITLCRNKNQPDGIWLADLCQWEGVWTGRTNWEDVVLWTEIENIFPACEPIEIEKKDEEEPVEIIDDDFVETAENCENYEEENKNT